MTHAPLTFRHRAHGSFLGLAHGDQYGSTLEFVPAPAVYTKPVDPTAPGAHWTDDTHMTLYVAKALAPWAGKNGPLDEQGFGYAVGEQFARWLHDPLTPSTAPGNTCLAGARAFERSGDWRTSGVRTSDGCGAVMRVAALPILLKDDSLTRFARTQALVTHAHPNAPDAAVLTCWLQSEVLDDGLLGVDQVRRVLARGHAEGLRPEVLAALQGALDAAERHVPGAPLDEHAIPAGDGGWRSPSCLGLAVYANLIGGTFAEIVERAARIGGDSDSVAAVAGMFAGAVAPHELPDWPISRRDELVAAVDALIGPYRYPRERTSMDDPLRVVEVTPDVAITMAPGKVGRSISGYFWKREVSIDLGEVVRTGRRQLICLLEDDELRTREIEHLPEVAAYKGLAFHRFPVRDLRPPSMDQMREMLALIRARPTVVHCMGGVGRAGTVAACVLVADGLSPDAAIAAVRRVRPRAVETESQRKFVHAWAEEIASEVSPGRGRCG